MTTTTTTIDKEAVLYAAAAPSAEQKAKFEAFLAQRYGQNIRLVFCEDKTIQGFRLEVGSDIYDFRKGTFRAIQACS